MDHIKQCEQFSFLGKAKSHMVPNLASKADGGTWRFVFRHNAPERYHGEKDKLFGQSSEQHPVALSARLSNNVG